MILVKIPTHNIEQSLSIYIVQLYDTYYNRKFTEYNIDYTEFKYFRYSKNPV